jgi:hypothetical protein
MSNKNPLLESTPIGETETAAVESVDEGTEFVSTPADRGEEVVESTPDVTFAEDELENDDSAREEFVVPPAVTQEVEYPDTGSDKRFFEGDYVTEIVNEDTEEEPVGAGEDSDRALDDGYTAVLEVPSPDYTAVAPRTDEREFKKG